MDIYIFSSFRLRAPGCLVPRSMVWGQHANAECHDSKMSRENIFMLCYLYTLQVFVWLISMCFVSSAHAHMKTVDPFEKHTFWGSEGLKFDETSIKNRCKIEARKSDAETVPTLPKMGPKSSPNRPQNPRKTMRKIDRKLKANILRQIDEQSDQISKKADTLSPEGRQDR